MKKKYYFGLLGSIVNLIRKIVDSWIIMILKKLANIYLEEMLITLDKNGYQCLKHLQCLNLLHKKRINKLLFYMINIKIKKINGN